MEQEATAKANPHADDRLKMLAHARRWWRRNMVRTVSQEHAVKRVKEEGELAGRYIFMTSMSAGIAVLGLILSSPAVVIGAMLLSPLMGPIIGAGFALAIWDPRWMRETARSLFVGTVASILIAALITWLSPIQTVTPEIASRTRPSLLDLAVALFSGLAGSYAMIRGRSGTIVGVAIAVALMPPLAVVGFGLATWNWTVFGGALLLFITNLVTIAATSAAMARLYGFHSTLSQRRGWMQSLIIIAALILLAVPLSISLSTIAWETRATRAVNQAIEREFDPRSRLDFVDIDFNRRPMTVRAGVLTPDINDEAEARIERILGETLERPVEVSIDQFEVGVDADAAEQAALAAARGREAEEALERRIDTLTQSLALVAGVDEDAISIDRDARRARVTARPIEGATLAAYRALEDRVASGTSGWQVELVPPLRALPAIALDNEGAPDPEALATVRWAAQRRDLPVALSGSEEAMAAVRDALDQAGITVTDTDLAPGASQVEARWALP